MGDCVSFSVSGGLGVNDHDIRYDMPVDVSLKDDE